jgi:predicted O-methyltransferase YrrM
MVKARLVFEMGSGYGYSTAWFVQAVKENGGGKVHHVVWDIEESQRARQHLEKLDYSDLVNYHMAEAIETLSQSVGNFDIIFNDIYKECYLDSHPLIHEKLRPGGVLIIDNLLWDGRALDENDHDPSTQWVRELTRLVITNLDWISNVVPIRDGMLVESRC